MKQRTRYEATFDKRANVKNQEAAGNIVDSMEVRLALIDRFEKGEITMEQMHAELKRIKRSAKASGKLTRAQAFSRG